MSTVGSAGSAVAGSVTDSATGLVWESGASTTAIDWTSALAHCEALELDGVSTWRLPNLKELASIVDDSLSAPAISTVFASRPATVFWTSTPVSLRPSAAYKIDFATGRSTEANPTYGLGAVRCVH